MELKKYKLQDLVANGSNIRRKVNSDLLVGNTSFGYGYGDIFDANATTQLMEEKLEELNIEDINKEDINQLKQKDIEHDGEITTVKAAVEDAADNAATIASELSSYKTSNDTAVAANATAISNEVIRATGAEDAINTKIGTVTTGKTVVEMIADAQAAATYDDTALAARVSANEGDLTVLKAGASAEGSVAYQIAQIVNENNNGSIDTLNEIAAWIISDTTGAAKMVADINSLSNVKSDKVASATAGNFAGLDANGNLTDSGAKASDFATVAQGAKADTAVQDASYVHTDNNYTTAEKSKLAAVSASVSGDTLTITTIAA